MKNIIYFLIFVFSVAFASAYICQDVNIIANMPCDLITPYNYPQPCSSNHFYVYSVGVNIQNYTMAFYNLNYCYASLNLTQGNYLITTNLNDSATIKIITNSTATQLNITSEGINFNFVVVFAVLLWAVFLWLSFATRVPAFLIITSFLTMGLGIAFYYMLPDIAMLNLIISFIMVLVGIMFLAYAFFKPH